MTKIKKIAAIGAIVLTITVISTTAFAASNYKTPAEAVAGLTGQTVESVIAERTATGKTYGTIANEAGKLTEFKAEVLETKKDALAEKVAAGTITQARADEITAALEQNQTTCDGTGTSKIGQNMGAGFGNMGCNGESRGQGHSQGKGQGGIGYGQGLSDGICQVQ